jgi:hypothetical protein
MKPPVTKRNNSNYMHIFYYTKFHIYVCVHVYNRHKGTVQRDLEGGGRVGKISTNRQILIR